MARKDTLGKLKMPKKPLAEEEAEMDLGMLDEGMEDEDLMAAEEGAELDDEMLMDEEGLAMFSDEELVEEMKLRGLDPAMFEADEEEASEEDEDEGMELE